VRAGSANVTPATVSHCAHCIGKRLRTPSLMIGPLLDNFAPTPVHGRCDSGCPRTPSGLLEMRWSSSFGVRVSPSLICCLSPFLLLIASPRPSSLLSIGRFNSPPSPAWPPSLCLSRPDFLQQSPLTDGTLFFRLPACMLAHACSCSDSQYSHYPHTFPPCWSREQRNLQARPSPHVSRLTLLPLLYSTPFGLPIPPSPLPTRPPTPVRDY
jgi:hypothetical protein